MVRLLLKLKNRLLAEALREYLLKTLNSRFQIIILDENPTSTPNECDLVIFDPSSLRETDPSDFSSSKKVLIDTGLLDQEIIFYFIYYHLAGVFAKDTAPELIGKCVEVVLKGEIWLSKNLLKILWEEHNSFTQRAIPNLTQKEREIVKLVCEGLSNRDIAVRLSLSEQTVKSHINRIFKKTGAKNRNQLIRIYMGGFSSKEHETYIKSEGRGLATVTAEAVRKKLIIKSKAHST